ncbi:peptidase M16 [Companilactobacillus sp. RD055328]|uniref:EF-P 5-aminopentanol modification-associated protein YfmH n=1 Tax=Companilactobacillus sp. RD055328 TaxID=2916634 RepID=UPI001FC846A4|nr:pitrilysin family protein [Companilactobacillus sp. RD055328]GKQ43071.1 peptidase M16 [Companilactobacillus sp. RD055328]
MSNKLQVYSKKTSSGLNVQVIPMPKYNQVYGIAMTEFGSIDLYNPVTKQQLPAGIAHFIEHKLFAKEGYDISDKFALSGANANAYTSYTKTAYLFQTLTNTMENLEILLDLIQNPYFTTDNVDKERGIINQEVQMYADMPEWKIEQKLLGKLYPNDSISYDIAGTIESLAQINKDNLLETYKTFYNQKNMNLVLVGNLDPEKIFELVEDADVKITDQPVTKIEPTIKAKVLPGSSEVDNINQTKTSMGVRVDDEFFSEQPIKTQYMLNMMFEILIGESSKLYEELLNDRLANDNFGYSVVVERGYCFVTIGGDSNNPEELRAKLSKQFTFEQFESMAIDKVIERFKRDIIGSLIFSQNSPESIANQQAELYFYDIDINDLITIIRDITKEDLLTLAKHVLSNQNMSYFDLIGKNNE